MLRRRPARLGNLARDPERAYERGAHRVDGGVAAVAAAGRGPVRRGDALDGERGLDRARKLYKHHARAARVGFVGHGAHILDAAVRRKNVPQGRVVGLGRGVHKHPRQRRQVRRVLRAHGGRRMPQLRPSTATAAARLLRVLLLVCIRARLLIVLLIVLLLILVLVLVLVLVLLLVLLLLILRLAGPPEAAAARIARVVARG
jgi:hypothetical protein